MDASTRGPATNARGRRPNLESINLEASNERTDTFPQKLLHKGKECVSGGITCAAEGKTHYMLPPPPPNAAAKGKINHRLPSLPPNAAAKGKLYHRLPPLPPNAQQQPSQPFLPHPFVLDSPLLQRMFSPCDSGPSGLSLAPTSTQCDEPEDLSTESDEELEQDSMQDREDVDMAEGDDEPLTDDYDMGPSVGNPDPLQLGNDGLQESCSCSFCLKAAELWMDLATKDTQGRLTAYKKSKKRAERLIVKFAQDASTKPKATTSGSDIRQNTLGSGIMGKTSGFDIMQKTSGSDFMQDCGTLFINFRDHLLCDISKLQTQIRQQKQLLKTCKNNVEN